MSKITIANSEAYNTSAFSAELTGYAAGYNVPDVEAALEFIAPSVRVPSRRFEYRKFGKGQFAVDVSDERSVFGEFKMINNPQEIIQEKLVHRGLSYVMDEDEIDAGDENRVIEELKKRLLRNELIRANVLVASAATSTSKNWTAASSNTIPDADLSSFLFDMIGSAGMRANRLLFGGSAFQKRFEAYENSDKDGSTTAANLSLQQLALKLRVADIMISEDIYETISTSDGSKKKQAIISANGVYAFMGNKGISREDPSTFKRFVGKDGFKVYVDQKAVTKVITVSHYSKLAQTCTGALALSIS